MCVTSAAAQLSFYKNGFTKSYAVGVKAYFLTREVLQIINAECDICEEIMKYFHFTVKYE